MCKDSRDACGTCGCVMFVKSVGLYIYVSIVSIGVLYVKEWYRDMWVCCVRVCLL